MTAESPPRCGTDRRRFDRVAVFGGVYSNHLALERCIEDARRRDVDAIFCLGDLGGFGPDPGRVFPPLVDAGIRVVQGNYDHSIGHDRDDCACGYTDPKDNYFARLSYRYTYENTPGSWKPWLRELPPEIRFRLGEHRVLLCHGSPRRTNEFVWESATSTAFLERLATEHDADVVIGSHTGLHWKRRLAPSGGGRSRWWVNAGVIGRPANDGRTAVWYTILEAACDDVAIEFVPLEYDVERLASAMRAEGLPEEFIETIETGWWTTCLEVLPQKERRRGKY